MTLTKDLRTNRGELKQRNQTGLLGQDDDFIEDGTLVSVKKNYKMINGKMEFIQNIRDSITLDKHGNLIYGTTCGVFPTRTSRSQRSCGPFP